MGRGKAGGQPELPRALLPRLSHGRQHRAERRAASQKGVGERSAQFLECRLPARCATHRPSPAMARTPPRLSAPSCSPTLPSPRGCACGLCCWRPRCTKPLHHAGGEHGEGPKPFGEIHVSGSPLQHGAERERGRPPSTRTVLPPLHSWKGYTTLFTYTTRNRAPRKEI